MFTLNNITQNLLFYAPSFLMNFNHVLCNEKRKTSFVLLFQYNLNNTPAKNRLSDCLGDILTVKHYKKIVTPNIENYSVGERYLIHRSTDSVLGSTCSREATNAISSLFLQSRLEKFFV